jgi:hypothetical protein
MGLVGLLATVVVMVVASWYMLSGPSSSNVALENDDAVPSTVENTDVTVPADANSVAGAQALIGQAKDLKATLESQAAATMAEGEDTLKTSVKPVNSGANEASEAKAAHEDFSVIDKKVSFGFSVSSGRKIDTVVLHSSYDALGSEPYSVSGTIKEYQGYGVAPHYLIDRKGNVYRLVDDKNIAYHAGESKMKDGRMGVNTFSIGIELLNKEDDKYTNAQYVAVNNLISYLKGKYPITSVVGHDDIAPGRKTDPWNFEWKRLK